MDENRTSILLSRAPHAHLPGKSTGVCADVLLAAAPAALLAVVSYGVRALLLMLLSALTSLSYNKVWGSRYLPYEQPQEQ